MEEKKNALSAAQGQGQLGDLIPKERKQLLLFPEHKRCLSNCHMFELTSVPVSGRFLLLKFCSASGNQEVRAVLESSRSMRVFQDSKCIIAGYNPSFSAARAWPSSLEEAESMRGHQEGAGRRVWRKEVGWK